MTTGTGAPRGADVSVVIVNFNGAAFIGDCLEALHHQTSKPREVILVDNASTDQSVWLIREAFPDVRLILNRENRGYSGGCNDGVAIARGDWIALLNPDTRPEPRWLEELLVAAGRAKRGDLMRSLVIDDGAPMERYRLIETMNIVGRLVRVAGREGDFAFAAAGAAMLFEKSEYPVPYPDEYFLYHEDLFMSWSARLQGHEVVFCRNSRVPHISQATTGKHRGVSTFHGEKNRITNFLVLWEFKTLARLFPLMAFDVLVHLPYDPANRLKALAWVAQNRKTWRRRRRELQGKRTMRDDSLLPLLSGVVSPRRDPFNRFYNAAVLVYCKAFRLPVIEVKKA